MCMKIDANNETNECKVAPEKDVKKSSSNNIYWRHKNNDTAQKSSKSSLVDTIRYELQEMVKVEARMNECSCNCDAA